MLRIQTTSKFIAKPTAPDYNRSNDCLSVGVSV